MDVVERIQAHVALDDPDPVLERVEAAVAAGDESWERWLQEYRRGEALIVRVTVTVQVNGETVEATNRGVFVENDPQPPKMEQQIAELAGKDFFALAQELAARGHEMEEAELHSMYVHVSLGEDVLRALAGAPELRQRPEFEVGLSSYEQRR